MSLGIWQILLIVLLVLILFGAGKLPAVMSDLAKGVKNFKKGMEEDDKPKTTSANAAAEKSAAPKVAEKKPATRKKSPAGKTAKPAARKKTCGEENGCQTGRQTRSKKDGREESRAEKSCRQDNCPKN